jgi:hypothetical protein
MNVVPAKAGIQRNSLDTAFRRYDKMDFHIRAGIQIFQGFLEPPVAGVRGLKGSATASALD